MIKRILYTFSVLLIPASAFIYFSIRTAGETRLFAQDSATSQAADRMSVAMRPRDFGGPEHIRARAFLWEHWSKKKPAQLDVTAWTREGMRTDWHYVIVIQENALQRLAITQRRSEDPNAPIAGLAIPQGTTIADIPRVPTTIESYSASSVERIRRVGDSDKVITLPADKVLPATKYRLRFQDRQGQILGTF